MTGETQLPEWEGFYVIVGAAGGALVGIQFVVITLIADLRRRASADTIHAFATPTVVHFGAVLVVSAVMTVPWPTLLPPAATLAACGLAGIAYASLIVRRARRQTIYRPQWDDWLWYAVVPGGAYAVLAVAAVRLTSSPLGAELGIGTAALVLLLVGIRNAWDTVTHLVVTDRPDKL